MSNDALKALQAYERLISTLQAVADDPYHPGAEEALTNAAYDANHAMADVGLVERQERPES